MTRFQYFRTVRGRLLTLISLSSLAALSGSARADDCGNITDKGLCRDAKSLVFCDGGELETMRCPAGELCTNNDRFGGAAGCLGTRYAGCGLVPEEGLCAGQTLLYCANNSVQELECPAGTTCKSVLVDGVLDNDCVATAGLAGNGTEVPVEPGQDGDEVDDSTPVETAENAPLPSVQKGGAGPASDYAAGGGGGGCTSAPSPLWLGALGLLFLRRRRLS